MDSPSRRRATRAIVLLALLGAGVPFAQQTARLLPGDPNSDAR